MQKEQPIWLLFLRVIGGDYGIPDSKGVQKVCASSACIV